ncbi:MAG: tryptophan 2,3-dioxygenase family protein [Labrys sp. (in: a-proteobacteria)]|jgi:tryptophan 2,3-dioxygenase
MPDYDARPLPPLDPTMDASANHYWSYHSLPVLLACKKPLTASKDEDLFIAVHQICEIAFHQMILDLDRALDAFRLALDEAPDRICGDVGETCYFLDRVVALWRTVNTTMPILTGLRAFAEFRTSIGPTSGFQSVQFRRIEIMSGVTDAFWRGGTADKDGKVHVAETEFDRRHGAEIAAWFETYRTHSLAHHATVLATRRAGGDHPGSNALVDLLIAYERAQEAFHRLHLKLAVVQLKRVGADVGTGGTPYRDYLQTYSQRIAPLFPGLAPVAAG